MIGALWASAALAWSLLGTGGRPTGAEVEPREVFAEGRWNEAVPLTAPGDLADAARQALERLNAWPKRGPSPVGMLSELGVTPDDVRRTLEWVLEVADEDAITGENRLSDPAFLALHLRKLEWRSDTDGAARRGIDLDPEQVRVTQYLVWSIPGSATRTAATPYALYSVPREESGVAEVDADALIEPLRTRLTRQQVLAGAFDPGGCCPGAAKALVWLSDAGVQAALLQGTVRVDVPGRASQFYTVHRNNGHPFVSGLPASQQTRYWYFRPTHEPMGWAPAGLDGAHLVPEVSAAGDVFNLGYGLLLSLENGENRRFAVLQDTGGAFQPNLFQLDLFMGLFQNKAAYDAAAATLPRRHRASVLLLREATARGETAQTGGNSVQ